ncbi:ferritin family protein [Geomonas sp. RF6]|uniref:ferritin family protein n=1 Tax=Geomonas sp. RF6 TaxID=2897342 RepID=UPI001E573C42|nr:ferritin family protein [Geomonas sp. RF6]UFS70749.1 ferritin family protein [Geomonas sp. RF6]
MNIFECAITKEEKAKAYYEHLEKESILPEQKQLFSLLAAAEQQHIDALRGMKETMAANGSELEMLNEPHEPTRLPDGENMVKEMKRNPDLFLHAVQEEERDISYYEDLAAKVEDAGVRVNLLLIAEEERKHLEVVENVYSYAEAPRNYLVAPEFGNMEEL